MAPAIEGLLGLAGGDPVVPGLYFPELLIDPACYVRYIERFGAPIWKAPDLVAIV